MGQDIREMFRKEREKLVEGMLPGHSERFANRLEQSFPQEKPERKFIGLKIAAVLVVALGVGWLLLPPGQIAETNGVVENTLPERKASSDGEKNLELRDISPEFRRIENFYLASLNMELARLEVNEGNKQMIDSFMQQLAELDEEYGRLNAEIREWGANGQTIEAMIINLQFRLELLQQVKRKIEEVKQTKKNRYENVQV